VSLDLLSGRLIIDALKGNLNDLAHVFNHILDVVCGLLTVRVDRGLPCAGEMVSVFDGCSELGLDHGWLLGYKAPYKKPVKIWFPSWGEGSRPSHVFRSKRLW
jgi:hypothetical protein